MVRSLDKARELPELNLTGLSSRLFEAPSSAERAWLAMCAVRPLAATNGGGAGATGAASTTSAGVVSASVVAGSRKVGDIGP